MSKNPFKFLLQFTVAAAFLVPVLVGCAAEDAGETGDPQQQTEDQLTTCNAGSKTAWQAGQNLGLVKLMKIDDKLTTHKTGHAFLKLKKQMADRGVTITINSGFRTYDEQKYFYGCYQTKRCNNGNLAAKPGYSNHQHGRALDLQISNHVKFKQALKALGLQSKWKNTVAKERWHWEYFGTDPGGVCDADTTEPTEETTGEELDTEGTYSESDNTFDGEGEDFSDQNIPDDGSNPYEGAEEADEPTAE